MAHQCCPPSAGPPIVHDYTPTGLKETLGDLPVYVAGSLSGKMAIIAVPDIFGFAFSQIFQVSDRLAEAADASVIAMDPFRGKPWHDVTLSDTTGLVEWIGQVASWEKVKLDVEAAIKYAKDKGATSFGIVGFCWGAMIACQAGIDGLAKGVAGVHPSLFGQDKELATALEVPICLIPAKGDPMESLKEVLDTKPAVASKCVYQRMDDQTHGFCGARGDYSKDEVRAGAAAAIATLGSFFKAI